MLLAGMCLAATQLAGASIIEISIPIGSQSPLSRPANDQVWDVQAQGGVLDVNLGVGIIVNPVFVIPPPGYVGTNYFPLHQDSFSPAPYVSAYVPDPENSSVVFQFDQATIVSGIEIVQHVNGVTQLNGKIGTSLTSLIDYYVTL